VNGHDLRGELTFRQRDRWVSELDWCVASVNVVDRVRNLDVNQDVTLPSNHAIVSCTVNMEYQISLDDLLQRAQDLGGHACTMVNRKQFLSL